MQMNFFKKRALFHRGFRMRGLRPLKFAGHRFQEVLSGSGSKNVASFGMRTRGLDLSCQDFLVRDDQLWFICCFELWHCSLNGFVYLNIFLDAVGKFPEAGRLQVWRRVLRRLILCWWILGL